MKRFGESDVLYPTSSLPFSLLTELQLYSGVHPSPHRLGLQRRMTHPCQEMDLPGLSQSQSLGHLPMTGLGMSMWHNSGHRDMRGSVLGELLARLLILERIPRKSWFLPLLDADVIGYDSEWLQPPCDHGKGRWDCRLTRQGDTWAMAEHRDERISTLITSPSLTLTHRWSYPL